MLWSIVLIQLSVRIMVPSLNEGADKVADTARLNNFLICEKIIM